VYLDGVLLIFGTHRSNNQSKKKLNKNAPLPPLLVSICFAAGYVSSQEEITFPAQAPVKSRGNDSLTQSVSQVG
jgi:hypothetical protein